MIIVNLITFVIWRIDKEKAKNHNRRISEKTLLIMSALGGFIGAIGGMTMCHHKTIKSKFLWKFRLIVFGWIVLLILIYYFLYR